MRLVVVERNPPIPQEKVNKTNVATVSSAGNEDRVDGGGVPVDVVVAPVEVGRALVNYSAAEIMRIKGMKSTEIGAVLGYADSEYVALRENVSLTKREKSRPVTPSANSSSAAQAN